MINKELKAKLNALAIISNEKRFNILLALLTSSIMGLGKHSHTFTQLQNIMDMKSNKLSYHIIALNKAGLITKKDWTENDKKVTYYNISKKGKSLLKTTGLTPDKIKKAAS